MTGQRRTVRAHAWRRSRPAGDERGPKRNGNRSRCHAICAGALIFDGQRPDGMVLVRQPRIRYSGHPCADLEWASSEGGLGVSVVLC
jgi:hypothetical protein